MHNDLTGAHGWPAASFISLCYLMMANIKYHLVYTQTSYRDLKNIFITKSSNLGQLNRVCYRKIHLEIW